MEHSPNPNDDYRVVVWRVNPDAFKGDSDSEDVTSLEARARNEELRRQEAAENAAKLQAQMRGEPDWS